MKKQPLAAAVEACFPPYRSACSLQGAYRVRWHGTLKVGRYVAETPDVWGRFA